MTAYYNEIDPYAAQWLRNLIIGGLIAPGHVDERSIEDVKPEELRGFTQCHFFAGVGVWSLALRGAGWPDNRPVWTGSCPCQPFSAAGKGAGFTDERHLWPAWFHLITQCQPDKIFGEQVASKDGLGWLDLVQTDLEGAGYASGAVDLCAAGVGAPHIRQRLWFVAERLADLPGTRRGIIGGRGVHSSGKEGAHVDDVLQVGGLVDPESVGGRAGLCDSKSGEVRRDKSGDSVGVDSDGQPGPTNGFWRAVDWLYCRDGKWRPVRPGALPLANGAPSRVGRLRAYGNAINAETATEFIRAYLECQP